MGLKGAASSGMEAYKCWSFWSLLPAAWWSGHEEQYTQRPEEEGLRADKGYHRWGTAREEVRLCVDGGWVWFVSLWCSFSKGEKFSVCACRSKRFCPILSETRFCQSAQSEKLFKTKIKQKVLNWEINLLAFLFESCQSFAIDRLFYVGHRMQHVGHWSLCFGCSTGKQVTDFLNCETINRSSALKL